MVYSTIPALFSAVLWTRIYLELKQRDMLAEAEKESDSEVEIEIEKEVLPDYKDIMLGQLEEALVQREKDNIVHNYGKSYQGRVRDIERMVREFKEKSKVDDVNFHNRLDSLKNGLKMDRREGKLGRDPFV